MTATRPRHLVALRYEAGALRALDQTRLPFEEVVLELRTADEVADAIRRLAIRGAPLIGVAAGYGLALELQRDPVSLERACAMLLASRPTAVNLLHAIARVRAAALRAPEQQRAAAALAEAAAVHAEEEAASDALARHGADLPALAQARRVLTHCNTGALASPGGGTALAVVAELAARGRLESVLACETRPLLQGARLTVYELGALGIDHELIVDAAAAGLIAAGAADAVIVGCDRVAADGDIANKVGTLSLALAAAHADIPLVVVGPTSTIDPGTESGAEIEIEERPAEEVLRAAGTPTTVTGTRCRNPAFDVTPARLVTAFVTERGVASPVSRQTLGELLARPPQHASPAT